MFGLGLGELLGVWRLIGGSGVLGDEGLSPALLGDEGLSPGLGLRNRGCRVLDLRLQPLGFGVLRFASITG